MRRNWKWIRRALGAPTSALVLLAGAAGPLLDTADLVAETRLASSQEAGGGGPGHNHRLCLHIGANPAALSLPGLHLPARLNRAVEPDAVAAAEPPSRPTATPVARAPPSR